MDFFNIGTGELVFLVLLAILLVGPKRAVELVQQTGRFAARLQKEWRSVQRDVMAEVQALKVETLEATSPLPNEELQEMAAEVRAFQKRVAEIKDPAQPAAAVEATVSPPGALGVGQDRAG